MASKRRGLGKGLNELLSATLGGTAVLEEVEPLPPEEKETATLQYLPLDKVVGGPFQPRQHIDREGLEQLAESMRAQGILQPIVVRVKRGSDQYEIIAGERRWRAAQLAEMKQIPVLIRSVSDDVAMAMALIENIQRENLNPIEEALALKRLSETLNLTHLQIAETIGKSRASVTNLLRLLTLNPDVQVFLEQQQLEMGHARALLGLKGPMQSQVAQTVVQRGLSVRETERLVNKLQEGQAEETGETPVDPNIRRLEEDLSEKLGAQVNIRHGRKGQGMVVIRYYDVDELEGILAHIK